MRRGHLGAGARNDTGCFVLTLKENRYCELNQPWRSAVDVTSLSHDAAMQECVNVKATGS